MTRSEDMRGRGQVNGPLKATCVGYSQAVARPRGPASAARRYVSPPDAKATRDRPCSGTLSSKHVARQPTGQQSASSPHEDGRQGRIDCD